MMRRVTLLTLAMALLVEANAIHADSVTAEALASTETHDIASAVDIDVDVGSSVRQDFLQSHWTLEPASATVFQATPAHASDFTSAIQKERALGLVRYQLDHKTAVLGWRVAPRWFLGQQRGDDSGLTLVWQKDGSDQLSLSKDGVRISRRF
ncbi:MAG: hypothetical protein NXH85_14930 [Pseudomonadaceae bacterium]|nr:hypothetical protein [Pseudomonadaceae bacterium]